MRHRTILLLLILGLVFLPACAGLRRGGAAAVETPRLIVMSAFDAELAKLLSESEIAETRVMNGRSYHAGELAGKPVVLVLSGVSMVNAAMVAQTALDHFEAAGIVFSGIAGGVNPDLNIGDVVVPAQWGQYQENRFARETPEGWDAGGSRTKFGNFGMMFPGEVKVTRRGGRPDAMERRFWFPVSERMLKTAREVAETVRLESVTPKGVRLSSEPRVVVGGNGVSGPTFVDNAAYREWVWKSFRADALDMETAAVAHVAYVNGVPYIAFRSLSDLAGGGPGENEIDTFFQLAADNSAAVVIAFVGRWEGG